MIRPLRYPAGWKNLPLHAIADRLQQIDKELTQNKTNQEQILDTYGFDDEAHYNTFSTGIRRDDLQAVEGVSLETWVTAFVSSIKNEDIAEAHRITGKDQAAWERISQEWSTRMANDASMVILSAYTNAMKNATASETSTVEAEIPFQRFVEIEIAIQALHAQGKDRQEVLDYFSVSILQWLDATIYWKKEMQTDSTSYTDLYEEYASTYRLQYEAGDSNADIDF